MQQQILTIGQLLKDYATLRNKLYPSAGNK
jgi:hypothetical protein